jgi:transposase InsO family protein
MTSQRRVRRLARAAGVECVHPRPYVRTTLPDAQARDGLADLVDRDYRPAAADQLRVGDLTYIHTFSGFAYLATVIDLFSNKVIGWMVADHMRTGLVLDALDMALAARRPPPQDPRQPGRRGAAITLALPSRGHYLRRTADHPDHGTEDTTCCPEQPRQPGNQPRTRLQPGTRPARTKMSDPNMKISAGQT